MKRAESAAIAAELFLTLPGLRPLYNFRNKVTFESAAEGRHAERTQPAQAVSPSQCRGFR